VTATQQIREWRWPGRFRERPGVNTDTFQLIKRHTQSAGMPRLRQLCQHLQLSKRRSQGTPLRIRYQRLNHRCGPSLAVWGELAATLERRAREIPYGGVYETGEVCAGGKAGELRYRNHRLQLASQRMYRVAIGVTLTFAVPPL
jgi:hypothetical protein